MTFFTIIISIQWNREYLETFRDFGALDTVIPPQGLSDKTKLTHGSRKSKKNKSLFYFQQETYLCFQCKLTVKEKEGPSRPS